MLSEPPGNSLDASDGQVDRCDPAEAHSDAPGLKSISELGPLDDEKPQVIVYRQEGTANEIGLAIVLAVYRGCLTKQGGKLVVRASKATAYPIPAECTRRVHAAVLEPHGENWCTSCAAPVLLLDPINAILGELSASCSATQARMHVQLSEGSQQDWVAMAAMTPPHIQGHVPENMENADVSAPDQRVSGVLSFNDRSFMRANLDGECIKFLQSLPDLYKSKGLDFIHDGFVKLPGGAKEKWAELVTRAPSYFLEVLKQSKGYAFSKGVHLKLTELLPSNGDFDNKWSLR